MTFLTIDQRDQETWYDKQEDKDKNILAMFFTFSMLSCTSPFLTFQSSPEIGERSILVLAGASWVFGQGFRI